MKIRTTEDNHQFTTDLFNALGAYSLQGLMMDSSHVWTAAVEAVEFNVNEICDFDNAFSGKDTLAKLSLARSIGIPLYYIGYLNRTKQYTVFEVKEDDGAPCYKFENKAVLDEAGFISWWKIIKGTTQTKEFNNGAQSRASQTLFDDVLSNYGLSWGGNIDGFIIRDGKPVCVLDNIYTRANPLDSEKADPAPYFLKRGPNYNTWFSTVKLANNLSVPHLLFTIDGNNNDERIGLTVIDHLSQDGIYYRGNIHPYNNIINGIDQIVTAVNSLLSETPPYIES